MDFATYINTNYLSSGTYVKVSITIDDKYTIASVYNPNTKKTQAQSYDKVNNMIIYGRDRTKTVRFVDANNIEKYYCEDKDKDALKACADTLVKAFKSFYKKYQIANSREVVDYINSVINAIYAMLIDNNANTISMKQEKSWHSIDFSKYHEKDIVEIIQAIQKNSNSQDGTLWNGKLYRVIIGQGLNSLQVYDDSNTEVDNTKVDNTPQKTRKYIQMAKMKNAEGLTEFINGNFYNIVKSQVFNGKTFYELKNDSGETRYINKNRLEIIEVYTEPPIAKP